MAGPYEPTDSDPRASPGAHTGSPRIAQSPGRKKLLIVDDSSTVRSAIQNMLSGDYECITAQDGLVGLRKARSEHPDAMVVDLEMPHMNGIELLRTLKADARLRTVPVIIITTVMALNAVNECRALGCDGFALKPVDPSYLRAKLQRLLNPTKP